MSVQEGPCASSGDSEDAAEGAEAEAPEGHVAVDHGAHCDTNVTASDNPESEPLFDERSANDGTTSITSTITTSSGASSASSGLSSVIGGAVDISAVVGSSASGLLFSGVCVYVCACVRVCLCVGGGEGHTSVGLPLIASVGLL